MKHRAAKVGDRVRCWLVLSPTGHGHAGELGIVRQRYNSGYGWRSYQVELSDGRKVYLCQGAMEGFKLEEEN